MNRNQKQKNKPFKGSVKRKHQHKTAATKKIHKIEKTYNKVDKKHMKMQMNEKKEANKDRLKSQFESIEASEGLSRMEKDLIKKQLKDSYEPKVILLVGMNRAANTYKVKQQILEYYRQNVRSNQQQGHYCFNNLIVAIQKQNYIILESGINYELALEYARIADIIIPVYSCNLIDLQKVNLDPHSYSNCYDENSYRFISMLRVQGLADSIGLLQDIENVGNKQKEMKKLFNRFYESEFNNDRFVVQDNEQKYLDELFRILNNQQNYYQLGWRNRAYMLVDQTRTWEQGIVVEGYLKGTSLNSNQLVHVTGYDDYQVHQIEVIINPFNVHHYQQQVITKQSDQKESLDMLTNFNQNENNLIGDNILSGINNNNNNPINDDQQMDEGMDDGMDDEEMNDEEMDEENSRIESQSDSLEYNEEDTINQSIINQQSKFKYELVQRSQDDLDMEDEADYQNNVFVKERFAKYQGLKSFKDTDWNVRANLPDHYNNIFTYSSFQQTRNKVMKDTDKVLQAVGGCYVRIYIICQDRLRNDVNMLQNQGTNQQILPMIVSSLYKYERKLTIVHFKVKYNPEYDVQELNSKESMNFQVGFRKFTNRPIFSQYVQKCKKTKYSKKMRENQYMQMSMYQQTIMGPANLMMVKDGKMVLIGEFTKNDTLQPIIKRKVLTGYPYKIHKRKCIVQMMFFNPQDIKYFRPIQMFTKLNLRGQIVEPVGTKGLMKCIFNSYIKQHDIVCLPIYKRVYPVYPF